MGAREADRQGSGGETVGVRKGGEGCPETTDRPHAAIQSTPCVTDATRLDFSSPTSTRRISRQTVWFVPSYTDLADHHFAFEPYARMIARRLKRSYFIDSSCRKTSYAKRARLHDHAVCDLIASFPSLPAIRSARIRTDLPQRAGRRAYSRWRRIRSAESITSVLARGAAPKPPRSCIPSSRARSSRASNPARTSNTHSAARSADRSFRSRTISRLDGGVREDLLSRGINAAFAAGAAGFIWVARGRQLLATGTGTRRSRATFAAKSLDLTENCRRSQTALWGCHAPPCNDNCRGFGLDRRRFSRQPRPPDAMSHAAFEP